MRVLYICGDFVISPVHKTLVSKLDALGLEVIVYVPINYYTKNAQRDSYEFKTKGSEVIYSEPLDLYYRILYKAKINRIVRNIEKDVDLSKVDVIHSALLCNEGGVAYELSKKYGIKYVSAIRNSDLNDYFRVFKWRIPYFKKIALSSNKLVCISKQYSLRIEKYFGSKVYNEIRKKLCVISNGLYDLYLDNRHYKETIHNPIKIVFTGGFQENKNIIGVFDAICLLRSKGYNIEFTAIGNKLRNHYEPKYAQQLEKKAEENVWFNLQDAQPKEQLVETLRNYDIFAMLSHTETFGLSYIEALSQGLPIVYSKGEGFDGMYQEGIIGYHASSRDTMEIAASIEKIIKQYENIVKNISSTDLTVYKWDVIALNYHKLYMELKDIETV